MSWALATLIALAAPTHPGQERLDAGAGFAALGLKGCKTDLLHLNQLSGWQVRWRQDWDELGHASDEEIRQAISHWRGAADALRRDREALEQGGKAKAPRAVMTRVLPQAEALSAYLARSAPPLDPRVSPALRTEWENLFRKEIAPAVQAYTDYLKGTYLAQASDNVGLARIRGSAECFRSAARFFSTKDLSIAQLEEAGYRLIGETKIKLVTLLRVRPNRLPERLAQLRASSDPNFDRTKLLSVSQAAANRGDKAAAKMFFRPAKTQVTFQPVPASMEDSFTAAAYLGSHGKGPPIALVNLSRPHERRLTAEAIAFHESLPGHHAAEALGYPFGTAPSSGYLEGWGMYAEQLADEMNLYTDDIDRVGMLVRRLAAAARPVVEVGLHSRGWTRTQAIAFLRDHSVLSEADLGTEVDRMIAGPGQPLSYILGYDAISKARCHAQKELGTDFDLRAFHHIILAKGARPLSVVQADVERWIAEKKRCFRKPSTPPQTVMDSTTGAKLCR
jgi:uncharacterized protein (DUF885 family)